MIPRNPDKCFTVLYSTVGYLFGYLKERDEMTMNNDIETKTFHIGDILSITDGRLVSPRHVDGIYSILNWMTGESLMTHQLPRASGECEDNLRAQHPDLAQVVVPEGLNSEGDVLKWLQTQAVLYGETREVAPLAADDHTRINPIAEIKMLRPDAQIIAL